MKRPLAIIATIFMSLQLWAQNEMPSILPMRERAAIIDQWLEERMEQVLPDLMSREKIDMWIIIAREYNEDPVIETMLPATWLSARRRTILLLYDQGEDKGVERLAVARYNVGKSFTKSWEKEQQPEQWDRLVELIEQRDPQRIAVNRSDHFALADGISATEIPEIYGGITPTI